MTFYANAFEAEPGLIARGTEDRQNLMRHEVEDYLRALSEDYPQRAAEYWQRDYSSSEAYAQSVQANRERWQAAVGDFGPPADDLAAELEPFAENEHFTAWWLTVALYGSVRGRAVLALPKRGSAPFPLVIAQHGIGSSPERVFGFGDSSVLYHHYGQRLCEAGYAVLAPFNLTGAAPRGRQTRLCLMLGKTLWGLEIAKIRRLLDYAATRPELDRERVAMWGISLGGAYTLFTMPLEPRIRAGICTAWFNHRVRKMVVDDPRYSCFLSTEEEHIFIPGWLREFSDSDLVSLIAPRPFLSQTGKGDGIAWWPFVLEEFERSREHYVRLGLEPERMQIDLHEGGHEIRVQTGLEFLRRWLWGGGGQGVHQSRGVASRSGATALRTKTSALPAVSGAVAATVGHCSEDGDFRRAVAPGTRGDGEGRVPLLVGACWACLRGLPWVGFREPYRAQETASEAAWRTAPQATAERRSAPNGSP